MVNMVRFANGPTPGWFDVLSSPLTSVNATLPQSGTLYVSPPRNAARVSALNVFQPPTMPPDHDQHSLSECVTRTPVWVVGSPYWKAYEWVTKKLPSLGTASYPIGE